MELYRSIVITGGRGMLAQAVVNVLKQRTLAHVALDRAQCDISRESDVARMFADRQPTLLINCAAHTKVDLCEDEQEKADAINGHGVGNLARAAREHGTFLVHYSTDFVFDGKGMRPYRPDDPVNPLSAYGRSKLLGEKLLQEAALQKWLIARTAWLYGRGGPNFPRTIIERGRQGQPLKVVSDQVGSPTYTQDLAEATFDLLDRNRTGIWHLTNSGQTSWHEFAKSALEEFGVKASVTPITTADWAAIRPKQAHRPSYSVLEVEAFARAVNRPMRPWRQGLRDFRKAVEQAGSL
ncbi:MAG TPA: dTDP-4-dehydrorhamnose reductase [Tepidisphaeraceae bacterium]|nr:dTDP-4-dehydrorhamnose reductase [Tepidisphaeraceae bacterium]